MAEYDLKDIPNGCEIIVTFSNGEKKRGVIAHTTDPNNPNHPPLLLMTDYQGWQLHTIEKGKIITGVDVSRYKSGWWLFPSAIKTIKVVGNTYPCSQYDIDGALL